MKPKKNSSDLRATIRAAMKRQGVSHAELGRRIGMAAPSVFRALDPRRDPKLSTIEKMLAAMGIDLEPHAAPARHERSEA